jgi:hypothetical protein
VKEWKKEGSPIPVPHVVKQLLIESFQKKYKCQILVETGTFYGEMIESQRNFFKYLYSIELNKELYEKAVNWFSFYAHINILQGDSYYLLEEITQKLTKQTIFWLDGHYSGGETAMGHKECPIWGELNAIFKNNKFDHIILIDDARCFIGKNDYPTIEEVKKFMNDKKYEIKIINDVICCYNN